MKKQINKKLYIVFSHFTIYNSKIQYNNKPLYIQTSKSQTRQGFVKTGKKYYCDLMFDNKVLNEIYNIGTSFRVTNLDIINKISEILNTEVIIKNVDDRLGHDKKYGLNCFKMRQYYMSRDGKVPEFLNLFDYLEKTYKDYEKII